MLHRPGRRPRSERPGNRSLHGHGGLDLCQVSGASRHCLHGRGEHPGRIGLGDPDPYVAHVHTDAHAGPHRRYVALVPDHTHGRPTVTMRPTSCSTSRRAWSALATSTPPPCATSSFPPPLPPSAAEATLTSALAETPQERASSLTATTTEGLPPDDPMMVTTLGWPAGVRPRMSRACLLYTSPS